MSERTERVEELFEAVLEQAPEDREQFLKKACGDDTSLRYEVETLVRHHEGAELSGFLDQRDAEGAGESVGVDDGRYVVVKKHASGSLGEVLVALDKDFERDVALKRVLPTMANDPLCRRRFEMEAKITGRLEHPGIVPVYSRGKTSDGEAFYAMKFIEGETMKAAIEQLHEQSRSKSQWNDNLRALLRRFIDVCHAIDFAHSRGVVHRDIKPANVVLGKFGESMVVDWGIAKLVDSHEDSQLGAEETLHLREEPDATATRTGSYLGTPAYMSPEQATGKVREVGPWSDVFGLGAMLYHILIGKPPYQGRDARETLVLASKGKWKFPRFQKRNVPHGLQSVCDKAMAKKHTERYLSAGVLATDIENWLEDRPLIGKADTLPEMIARFYRRNPMLAACFTVIVMADAPILVSLVAGADMRTDVAMVSGLVAIAIGAGAGQFLGFPGAILGGVIGLFREEGKWPHRFIAGAKSGFLNGMISGCALGILITIMVVVLGQGGVYMDTNDESLRCFSLRG
ncbi:MAG: protein kinase, partial [Planctomycetaceae bacterium]|nr:protein kinase [Planctomycetaceae bacterium]